MPQVIVASGSDPGGPQCRSSALPLRRRLGL